MPRNNEELLKLAKARFEQGQEADHDQLQRELDDISFYNGEQWPEDVRTSRAGQNASGGLPPVPARPCITINKVRQPVRQVLNSERDSDMGVEIAPADDFADVPGSPAIDDTEIELREGLVRRIQRESQAKDARTWAFARAVQAGRGYYGVMTRFVKNTTKGQPDAAWWDQEIYVHRFYNQAAVTLDPAHEQPDGSDAEWGTVGTWVTWDDYISQFPQAKDVRDSHEMSDNEFLTLGELEPAWFKSEGPQQKRVKMMRVVDYWYTERESKKLALLADGSVMWADQVPAGIKPQDEREVTQKSIKWCKIDGRQVLEETDWPGRYIPIIKIVGEELQPHDTQRRTEGLVRPAREANQGFNFMVSKWVETVGLAPLTPLMVEEGQVEGYEEWYNQANTRTLPYLPFKMRNLEGEKAAAPPFPAPRDVPIAPIAASVQMFDEAVKDTTGVPSVTLGDTDPSLKTARGAKLLLDQAKQGTSNFLDNLVRSVRHEGLIVNDLLYPIYNRPGRLARIVNGQGEDQLVLVNQPFTMQGEGKFRRPQAVQDGQQTGQGSPESKQYKLTENANFNVAIKITNNAGTRREQESVMLGEMISANPALMGVFGDLFFKNLDGPGHKEMAERAKVLLVPPVQKLLEGQQDGQAPIPPQVQAKLDQSGQLIEALTQKVNEQAQQIATDQAKQQATMETAKMDADVTLQKATLDAQVKVEVARINAAADLQIAQEKLAAEREQLAVTLAQKDMDREDSQRFEHAENAVEREHAAQQTRAQMMIAARDRDHDADMADKGHAQTLEQGERAHEQAEESAEAAAEREPKETP